MNRKALTASVQDVLDKTIDAFKIEYSTTPEAAAFAPGRVNLIGEHTDYNEGFVFPMALPLVTVCVAKKTGDSQIRVRTLAEKADLPRMTTFATPAGEKLKPGNPLWANYVKGAIAVFPGSVSGFDMMIGTSVPLGGGLSSSASIEVATFTLLEALFPLTEKLDIKQKAILCQKAEHTFAGMPCGIMDQFVSTMAKEGHALLIDCQSMEGQLVKLNLPDKAILVINSNVRHQLTGSEYPTRRKNCADAASALGVKSLRYADIPTLESKQNELDPVIYRRARHVITEIQRTQEATTALGNGNLNQFGKLMVESHNSLRDDFEVSCSELDQLVEIAMSVPGVLGSRMTGGGFGGCTVTLCEKSSISTLMNKVKEKYFGSASFIECTASSGASIITLNN